MKNLGNLMKQAQEAQARMQEMQAKIAQMTVAGESGAGMVRVTMSGAGQVTEVKIDPKLADPDDMEVLEDLIMAAVNDARGKVDQATQEETKKAMGGLPLPPGMKLPF